MNTFLRDKISKLYNPVLLIMCQQRKTRFQTDWSPRSMERLLRVFIETCDTWGTKSTHR